MPWVRIDEHALNHVKILALSADGFRLWVEGLSHCQRHLTDGAISRTALRTFRYALPAAVAELEASVDGLAPLWEPAAEGYQVHDYLQWNEPRERVLQNRQCAKQRMSLFKDPELRAAIRRRDGDHCRYCGVEVAWHDRRGPRGGTYDHVAPYGGNDAGNLVVACRSCNSRKGGRTLDECGLTLRPAGSKSDLSRIQVGFKKKQASTTTTTTTLSPKEQEREKSAPRGRIFDGKRLKVSQRQLDAVVAELGDKAGYLDFLGLFEAWDRELEASGAEFNTLNFLRDKAAERIKAMRAGGSFFAGGVAARSGDAEECQHEPRCHSRHWHEVVVFREQERARELERAG